MSRLAAVFLALAAAHPGHDDPADLPRGPVTGAEVNTPAWRLARSLLDRGQPGLAARLVAREAATIPEAARVLADALEELDDPVGARLARERADRVAPDVAPPANGGASGSGP